MNKRRPRNFADYSRVVRRRKVALLLPALVLAIATEVSLRELPNWFESTARMRVAGQKSDSSSDLSAHLSEFRKQLASRDTLEALVSDSKLASESNDALISQMRDRIRIEPEAGPASELGDFTVSYRATDAETARKTTIELANRLLTLSSREPSGVTPEGEVQRKRAADISAQLRELEARAPWLVGAQSDSSTSASAQPSRSPQPLPEVVRTQQMTIESLKDQQYKIQQQLTDADQRITAQRQIVEQQKRGSTLRDDPTYAVLIAKRTELQGQRDTLMNRQELTDKHPRVLAINDQIAAINRQVEELRQQDSASVTQSPEARELAARESERNRLRIDLEIAGRELVRRSANPPHQAAAPEASPMRRTPTASKLFEQYMVLKRSYQDAADDLQNREFRRDLAGAIPTQLTLLEQPIQAKGPVSPNRLLLTSISIAAGLGLGAFFALFAESRRFDSLQDARDVEYYTRLPLLGAIPKTGTLSELRHERWRAVARFALAIAASAGATLVLTRLLIAADAFALIIKK